MYSKFANLKPEKQNRIINAAISEFAKKGFKNASTDEIVKGADISKGSLFLYFKNKKDLFLFLYDHVLQIIMDEYFEKIELEEKDILKRLRQVLLIKLMLAKKYPNLFEFVQAVNIEDSDEVKDELNLANKGYITSSFSKILQNYDTEKFKEDIDMKAAVNVIIWTIEGFAGLKKERTKQIPMSELNSDEILLEVDVYLELLKKSFYK